MAPNAVIDTFVIVIIGGMGSFLGSRDRQPAGRLRAGVRHLLLPGPRAGADVPRHARRCWSSAPAACSARRRECAWRLVLAVACLLALAPVGLPPYCDDAADRGADPRPVRHEPRPDGRLYAAAFVRPRRGLRARRLYLRQPAAAHRSFRWLFAVPLARRSAASSRSASPGCARCVRRVVLHADAGVRATALRRGPSSGPVTGASDGLAASRAARARSASLCSHGKAGFYYLVLCLPVGCVLFCRATGALAVRRGAARHPRERGEDAVARLQHAPLQDRRGGDLLRLRRAGRRALRAIRRLRQSPSCCSGCSPARC